MTAYVSMYLVQLDGFSGFSHWHSAAAQMSPKWDRTLRIKHSIFCVLAWCRGVLIFWVKVVCSWIWRIARTDSSAWCWWRYYSSDPLCTFWKCMRKSEQETSPCLGSQANRNKPYTHCCCVHPLCGQLLNLWQFREVNNILRFEIIEYPS